MLNPDNEHISDDNFALSMLSDARSGEDCAIKDLEAVLNVLPIITDPFYWDLSKADIGYLRVDLEVMITEMKSVFGSRKKAA